MGFRQVGLKASATKLEVAIATRIKMVETKLTVARKADYRGQQSTGVTRRISIINSSDGFFISTAYARSELCLMSKRPALHLVAITWPTESTKNEIERTAIA